MSRLERLLPPQGPARILALTTLVNTMGNGAAYTVTALYFTRFVGLHPVQYGLALTVAGVGGLLVGLPAGQLADVRGPREVLRLLTFLLGFAYVGFIVSWNLWSFAIAAIFYTILDRAANAVRNGLTARLSEGADRVRFRAYLRAVTNTGISLGALLGGLALAIDTRWAFLGALAFNALSFFVVAVIQRRLPHLPAVGAVEGGPRLQVLHDRPFLAAVALNSVVAIHFGTLDIAMPLWVVRDTTAPTWIVSILLLVNTVAVASLQVRLARGTDDVGSAARAFRRGGLLIWVAFGLFAFASGRGTAGAILLLLAGSAVHVVGEMLSSAGQWGVQMGLAPSDRQGQYQGLASSGFALSSMLAPTVVTVACIEWGRPGWILLGAVLAAAGMAYVPVSAWAARTRDAFGASTATL
jgi:Major Facilitator Superfamily